MNPRPKNTEKYRIESRLYELFIRKGRIVLSFFLIFPCHAQQHTKNDAVILPVHYFFPLSGQTSNRSQSFRLCSPPLCSTLLSSTITAPFWPLEAIVDIFPEKISWKKKKQKRDDEIVRRRLKQKDQQPVCPILCFLVNPASIFCHHRLLSSSSSSPPPQHHGQRSKNKQKLIFLGKSRKASKKNRKEG